MKKIVRNKLFMLSLIADMVSNFGDVLYYLAMMNYVLLLPNTQLALSLITVSEGLPILIGLLIGVWADKTKQKLPAILATLFVRVLLYTVVGLVMGFSPSLWIVVVVCLVNLISDIAGAYESYLFMPVSLRVVSNDDREAAAAFRQGLSSILGLVFQSSGAIFIAFMTYQQLAFFNAGTFMVSLLITLGICPALKKLLAENPLKETKKSEQNTPLLADVKQSLIASYQAIQEIPSLKAVILVLMILNALFVALSPLVLLMLKENSRFVIVNPSVTISLVTVIVMLGAIVGSMVTTNLFKEVEIERLTKWSACMPVFLFIAFMVHSIYGVCLVLFLVAILASVINPKLSALIYREIPETQLATIDAGISTFFQLGMVFMRGIMAVLITLATASDIALIFFLLSFVLFIYTVKNMRTSVKKYPETA